MLYDPRLENRQVVKQAKQKWRQVLLDAADLLEKTGWCKRQFIRYDRDQSEEVVIGYCAIGAMRATNFNESVITMAISHLACEVIGNIPEWNDAQSDVSVVINKLREVAAT